MRVSVQCGDPLFQLGVIACLREAGFDEVAAGRGGVLDPTSFDLVISEWTGDQQVVSAAMVVVVPERSALSAASSWVAGRPGIGLVMRDGLTAEELLDCLRVVSAGGTVRPSSSASQVITVDMPSCAPTLTETERQLLARIQRGQTNNQIAEGLHLSVRSVKRLLQRLYSRLQLSGRVDAAVYATRRFGDDALVEPRRSDS